MGWMSGGTVLGMSSVSLFLEERVALLEFHHGLCPKSKKKDKKKKKTALAVFNPMSR